MKKVYIETYGCTLNQADSDIILGELEKKGYKLANSEKEADVVIVNTCTVKGATESKISNRMTKLRNERKALVIAGCMTANSKRLIKNFPNAVIVGTGAISHIADAVGHALDNHHIIFDQVENKDDLARVFSAPILRLPISEGCTNSCHFCQTKIARPGLRSYRPRTLIKWIKEGVVKGAKEIQMTSMDSGAYGLEIGVSLPELMEMANEIDGDFLVRLGMINPQHVKRLGKKLLAAIKLPKFYKFLHVPVQTGSEKVCSEMNRGHMVKDFYDAVFKYRSEIPEILLTTDLIVGYPTETKADFEDTLELIEKASLDVVNLSKFSARPGTKAIALKGVVSQEVKRRSELANRLIKKISAERNEALVGKEYEVLITERHLKKKDFTGRNINYKQVVVKGFTGKIGDKVFVEIVNSNYGSLFGKII